MKIYPTMYFSLFIFLSVTSLHYFLLILIHKGSTFTSHRVSSTRRPWVRLKNKKNSFALKIFTRDTSYLNPFKEKNGRHQTKRNTAHAAANFFFFLFVFRSSNPDRPRLHKGPLSTTTERRCYFATRLALRIVRRLFRLLILRFKIFSYYRTARSVYIY